MIDLYKILNIGRNADKREIKKAYRKAATKAHPDKEGGSKEKFHQIQVAYDVLGDDKRRQQYDRTGQTEQAPPNVAESRLIQLFTSIIQSENFTGNVIQTCRDQIANAKIGLHTKIQSLTVKKVKLQRQLGRIQSKGEFNFYEKILTDSLEKLEFEINGNNDELTLVEEVGEMLEEYTDERPEAHQTFGTVGGFNL